MFFFHLYKKTLKNIKKTSTRFSRNTVSIKSFIQCLVCKCNVTVHHCPTLTLTYGTDRKQG